MSYSIKDFTKVDELQSILLESKHEILKEVFIFDYFKNEEINEIKIGFRFVFQSKYKTLTSNQIEDALNDIIKKSVKISGVCIPGLKSYLNDNN